MLSPLMGAATSPSAAVALIAAMITPALLILGSASLVASALVRMARVVDRARALAAIAHVGGWQTLGVTPAELGVWLERHRKRAQQTERSIVLLYSAVVVFVATCLAIALDRSMGEALTWLPILLAMGGTLLLLAGGAWMVAESRLSSDQIFAEIDLAVSRLKEGKP
jgi:hypothetical protein